MGDGSRRDRTSTPSPELGGGGSGGSGTCSLIEVEDLLLQQPAFESPDLIERQFVNLDPSKKGFVAVDAFYSLMEGQPGNSLSRSELQVLSHHFTDKKSAKAESSQQVVNWRALELTIPG